MFSVVELDEGVMTEIHHHPEDQMGYILEGTFERHQGDEIALLKAGDVFFTPGGTPHGGRALGGRCRILDVFSPPRSKYMPQNR
jgi:quercetin dioxygenase-like cupin family protein